MTTMNHPENIHRQAWDPNRRPSRTRTRVHRQGVGGGPIRPPKEKHTPSSSIMNEVEASRASVDSPLGIRTRIRIHDRRETAVRILPYPIFIPRSPSKRR